MLRYKGKMLMYQDLRCQFNKHSSTFTGLNIDAFFYEWTVFLVKQVRTEVQFDKRAEKFTPFIIH